MSHPGPDRETPWLPGAILLASALALSVAAGWLLGSRSWTTYVGLFAGFVLLFGWLEKVKIQRPRVPARRRTHLKVIQGGRPYDLADDRTTDDQKYVM